MPTLTYQYPNEAVNTIADADSYSLSQRTDWKTFQFQVSYYNGSGDYAGDISNPKYTTAIVQPSTYVFNPEGIPDFTVFPSFCPEGYRQERLAVKGDRHPSAANSSVVPGQSDYTSVLFVQTKATNDFPLITNISWVGTTVAPSIVPWTNCTFIVKRGNDTIYTESRPVCPTVTFQGECPPDTCQVDCHTHYCCYNSQGISVFNYLK